MMNTDNSTRIRPTPIRPAAATLIDRVCKSDAKRIETINSRISDLCTGKDLDIHPTQIGAFVWEILRMPILDKAIAELLNTQYRRIVQMASLMETAMSVVAAREDREDGGVDRELSALWDSLDVVRGTLENIAEQIDIPASYTP
jgi:hypothetical protein